MLGGGEPLVENRLIKVPSLEERILRATADLEINRAIDTSSDSSLVHSDGQNSNRVPLVVTYYPNLPKLKQIIRRYHHILQESERLREAIPSLPVIAFRRPRNLGDFLVRSAIPPQTRDSPENFCFEARRCRTCPIHRYVRQQCHWRGFKIKAARLLQNEQHNLFNTLQEVWSPVCGRNRATTPLSNEQPPFPHHTRSN